MLRRPLIYDVIRAVFSFDFLSFFSIFFADVSFAQAGKYLRVYPEP